MIQTTLAKGAPWPYAPRVVAPKPQRTNSRVVKRVMHTNNMRDLLHKGEWTAESMCAALGMSRPATYRRLAILAKEGKVLATTKKERSAGQKPKVYYTWSKK